jgi:uncharacterized Zn-binding protein involved in type VI secretion
MGMPACTITSETAHGGTVILGFPTVLIGFMPASRITDMHVCPMADGPVPHVGGPFVMGSPTVIVGMMPQSRVTDQLVCVGPPDVAVMGCETVLVGEAGGGGAAGAAAGIQAMGAEVPKESPESITSSQPSSELQQDGTVKTSGPPGGRLPENKLSQPGWPDLPAEQAPNFQSAQPVNVAPGTTLYQVAGDGSSGEGSLWSPGVAGDEAGWRNSSATKPKWNNGGKVVAHTVPQEGLKAWAGPASSQGSLGGGAMQVYVPPGTVKPGATMPTPWAGKGQS